MSEHPVSSDTQPWICSSCGKENRGERRFCWNCEAIKGSPPGASPAKPLRSTQPSHTPDIQTPRADSPPPSDDLLSKNDTAKFDFKIALQAGLIGAITYFVQSLLFILGTASSFAGLSFLTFMTVLSWLIHIAIGALYVYIARRKGKTIGVGIGALGGAVTGVIDALASSALRPILNHIANIVLDSLVRPAIASPLTIWTITTSLISIVLLSTIGGLIYAAFVQKKPSATSILRTTIGCVVGFAGLIVGYFGLLNFLGDSNALGFYCNMPVALALLIFAWVMIRPRR